MKPATLIEAAALGWNPENLHSEGRIPGEAAAGFIHLAGKWYPWIQGRADQDYRACLSAHPMEEVPHPGDSDVVWTREQRVFSMRAAVPGIFCFDDVVLGSATPVDPDEMEQWARLQFRAPLDDVLLLPLAFIGCLVHRSEWAGWQPVLDRERGNRLLQLLRGASPPVIA